MLDLTSLEKSVNSLKRAVNTAEKNIPSADIDLKETIKAGVIQHFEVAYEMCWKFMQRYISENASRVEAEFPRTRKDLFRLAARLGIITDPVPWFRFGEMRNLTAHTYDSKKANQGYEISVEFLPYAEEVMKNLRELND